MDITIEQVDRIQGTVRVPGDKSIAHRALILGALVKGVQVVEGLPASADVASTAACLRTLGCAVEETGPGRFTVTPGTWKDGQVLDAGNSGTTARLLCGLAAGLGLRCTIDGDASLRRRPMTRIADPLARMGVAIQTAHGGCLPLKLGGGPVEGIAYAPPVASAQVKTAVLIAGLLGSGKTTVIEKTPTRDHTENMLEAMGVPIEMEGRSITVPGGVQPKAIHVRVPGDISSAAFFMAAASILPGSEVRFPDLGINPTRTGFLDVLKRMGADITEESRSSFAGEPVAEVVVRSGTLHGTDIQGTEIPSLIDELPVLAVVAARAEGITTVRDASELRHKESDRIRCIVENLTRLGAAIEERDDGFIIEGPCTLKGAALSSHGDHRIAMAMAVAGLVAEGSTRIEGIEAIRISYPGFFIDLRDLIRAH